MQKMTTQQTNLRWPILLAAILIAGSAIFLGVQIGQQPEKTSTPVNETQLKNQLKTELVTELASQTTTSAIDSAQLKEQIKTEILAELKDGDWIDQEVDAGIERYVQKQREAQEKVREEQERLANEKAKNVRRVSTERDHVYGNPNAEISLIEYSDFECPYCKTFHPTPKQIVDAYDGKVNWVFRHYPLSFHNPTAQLEAEASECVAELGGNDAFWKFTDFLYENSGLNGQGVPEEQLLAFVEELGLDVEQFKGCVSNGKYAERVQEDFEEGANSGITGTPGSILLNNQTGEVKLKSGALPFEAVKAEIEQLLQ